MLSNRNLRRYFLAREMIQQSSWCSTKSILGRDRKSIKDRPSSKNQISRVLKFQELKEKYLIKMKTFCSLCFISVLLLICNGHPVQLSPTESVGFEPPDPKLYAVDHDAEAVKNAIDNDLALQAQKVLQVQIPLPLSMDNLSYFLRHFYALYSSKLSISIKTVNYPLFMIGICGS